MGVFAAAAGVAAAIAWGPAGLLMGGVLLVGTIAVSSWPGFQCVPLGGSWMPFYAAHPIGYREASSILFRAELVRALAWAPLVLGYAAFSGTLPGLGLEGVVLGAKALGAYLALIPFATIFRFSAGTNDSERFGCLKFLVGGVVGLPSVAAGIAGIAMQFVPGTSTWAIGLALEAIASAVCWWAYGAFYMRGGVDLLRATKPGSKT